MGATSRVVCAALVAAGLAACNKSEARTPPPVVALDIPSPPPRVTVPVELPPPPPPAPPPVPVPEVAEEPSLENTAERTAAQPAVADPEPEPDTPAPVLRTTTDVAGLEKRILGLLAEAQQNLGKVARAELNVQARAQYDSAASFLRSARSALEIKNFLYAEQLASKAAAVARELVKG